MNAPAGFEPIGTGVQYVSRVCGDCRKWRWMRVGELTCPVCKGEVTG